MHFLGSKEAATDSEIQEVGCSLKDNLCTVNIHCTRNQDFSLRGEILQKEHQQPPKIDPKVIYSKLPHCTHIKVVFTSNLPGQLQEQEAFACILGTAGCKNTH